MKNIINSESLTQFKERIEFGMSLLQEQQLPVNSYTFGFIIQELNKFILEDEHPRYIPFVDGKMNVEKMDIDVLIADRFNQNEWVDILSFVYPQKSTMDIKPSKTNVQSNPNPRTIIPVPTIELFNSEVRTNTFHKSSGYTCKRSAKNKVKCKYTDYTEYINFVKVLFDSFSDYTECLNKSLIAAFLGAFAYQEAFVSNGSLKRQHLKLKDVDNLNEDVQKKFQIDWDYFLNNWSDNAITVAQYKSADYRRVYTTKGRHQPIDLIEICVGSRTYELTPFGKLIWEKVRDFLGLIDEEENDDEPIIEPVETISEVEEPVESDAIEVMATPAAMAARLGTEEQLEDHVEEKVEEAAKVRHMGYNKCNGCAYFDKVKQWCDKRQDYINSLEHDECFEEKKPELEVAPKEEVERICYNCKRWHSGNNPGNLKAIACRCPVVGRKTLTDNTCAKFVAIVRKED